MIENENFNCDNQDYGRILMPYLLYEMKEVINSCFDVTFDIIGSSNTSMGLWIRDFLNET